MAGRKNAMTLFCLLVAGVLPLAGCAPVIIGAAATAVGGHAWVQGNLELTVEYSALDLYAAVRRAMTDLNIMIERDQNDASGAYVAGRDPSGRRVLIRIVGQTEYVSRIRVRVGMIGNRDESHVIMNRILRNV